MLVNIEIINDEDISTKASFELKNLQSDKDFKEAMAIIFMIAGDYALDPEIELKDFKEFAAKAITETKKLMSFYISEDGLELEFQ